MQETVKKYEKDFFKVLTITDPAPPVVQLLYAVSNYQVSSLQA